MLCRTPTSFQDYQLWRLSWIYSPSLWCNLIYTFILVFFDGVSLVYNLLWQVWQLHQASLLLQFQLTLLFIGHRLIRWQVFSALLELLESGTRLGTIHINRQQGGGIHCLSRWRLHAFISTHSFISVVWSEDRHHFLLHHHIYIIFTTCSDSLRRTNLVQIDAVFTCKRILTTRIHCFIESVCFVFVFKGDSSTLDGPLLCLMVVMHRLLRVPWNVDIPVWWTILDLLHRLWCNVT